MTHRDVNFRMYGHNWKKTAVCRFGSGSTQRDPTCQIRLFLKHEATKLFMFGTQQTSTCLDTLSVFNDGTAKGVSEPYWTIICRTVSRRVTFPPSSAQRDRIDSVCVFFFNLYLLIPTNQDITNKTGFTFTCLFIFRWSEFMKAAPSGWSTIHCELLSLAPPIDKQRICSSWVWDTLSKRPVAYEAGLDTNENNWKLETYIYALWMTAYII
jgi:hypothetical protein